MAVQLHVDETSCGPMCQHPACWQSNIRQDKGFPRMKPCLRSPPDIELDLPTMKVYNMLGDYGNDNRDLYPAQFSGKPAHERQDMLHSMQKPIRDQSIKVTRAPQPSPKSGSIQTQQSRFKVVEVQEVFDPEDLQGTWDDTFVPKSYFMWVPNQKKKRQKKHWLAQSDSKSVVKSKAGIKDLTESMVPKELEHARLTARDDFPVMKPKPTIGPLNENHRYQAYNSPRSRKKRALKSPRPYTMTPRTAMASSKMEFDQEGLRTQTQSKGRISVPVPSRLSGWVTPGRNIYLSISELLDLPRDILVQVLENTRQSDLMSRERIREIIRRFMPPQLDRGNTNMSLASQDLLQQKKLNLHEGNKNVRQPHLMETKPVFYLDDDVMDEEFDEDLQRPTSPYGSLKDLYFGGMGAPREFSKYRRPLPAIGGDRAVSAGVLAQTKIPSISLGLPELPSGIKHTKAFTYKRKNEFDFTLGPVPTPPTSVRSTETPGSDHGTTIRVNMPSEVSNQSEHGSETRLRAKTSARGTPDRAIHSVSPTFSTKVPKAPATTPATYHPSSPPTRSGRDLTGSSIPNTPGEWPPKTGSPLQILRAPVNTPGSIMQDAGLGTIPENHTDDGTDQAHPMSRGRSVRFEIPEVPPPPSSPQLSDDGQKDPSRNTVTVNTSVPRTADISESTETKPMSGTTLRTDANTVNTSALPNENSFLRSQTLPTRELSMASTPEPWPQVNEADYEAIPTTTPESPALNTVTPATVTTGHGLSELEERAIENEKLGQKKEPIKVPSPEKEDSKETELTETERDENYVNKTPVEHSSEAVKKILEDSLKAESPAPPPPSPEPKQDSNVSANNRKIDSLPTEQNADSDMTVVQIPPKGKTNGKRLLNRQIDTFQNIDIPAKFDDLSENATIGTKLAEPKNETIVEESEHEEENETPEVDNDTAETKTDAEVINESNQDKTFSVQGSSLANRTVSEPAQSEMSSPMIEPAVSQTSHMPAMSDVSEKTSELEVFVDWTGVVGSAEIPILEGDSEKEIPDMTEDGGDHEGFKDDLRQEYKKLDKESEDQPERKLNETF
ncbi:uncharacterized protein LOC128224033 isoform X4 [Mya arenaria]|uniref:uncharacterized protein LOC128224033 isoform X4 n=1 Tax=Mya arenaria TaxID=6604 RepID=UPI0022E28E50|nr:uncharacterized protein LOC128224033 isoform X4 [Mya arenaria]